MSSQVEDRTTLVIARRAGESALIGKRLLIVDSIDALERSAILVLSGVGLDPVKIKLYVGSTIEVGSVLIAAERIGGSAVRVAICAPPDVKIVRSEILPIDPLTA